MLNRLFSPDRLLKRTRQAEPMLVGPAAALVIGPTPALVIAPAEALVIGPQPAPEPLRLILSARGRAPVRIAPPPAVQVQPEPRGLWDERGWTVQQTGGVSLYQGQYRITNRRTRRQEEYPGRIRVSGRKLDLYIADPPAGIRQHPKGPCFSPADTPWFHLHWHTPAHTVDDAILYMERILAESAG